MKSWIEVTAVFSQPPVDWSLYIDAFDKFGCPGTLQTDDPPSLTGYLVDVAGAEDRLTLLSEALFELGVSSVRSTTVPEEDWSEMWKIHFKPRRIGKRFVVRPTWEEYEVLPGDIELVLDPGQAFGTGDHPTTRVCLQALEDINLEGKKVLDLGCGSGILAIAASKLGANPLLATDIDEQSVEVTKENMFRNSVEFPVHVEDGFPTSGPWDVVISNIISATLIRFAPDAAASVIPGGYWVVSGIIEGNWPDVQKAAERVGFKLINHVQEDQWVGATFQR